MGHVGPQHDSAENLYRCHRPQEQSQGREVAIAASSVFSQRALTENPSTEVAFASLGDLLSASAISLQCLGESTSSNSLPCTWKALRRPAAPAISRTGVAVFGEGQPGGSAVWWKLVALSLIGGEFNFSNEPGTFLLLIRFAR